MTLWFTNSLFPLTPLRPTLVAVVVMLVAEEFTPELMLGAPRRSPAVPNYDGTLALYTVSTHVFGGKTTSELRVMTIESGYSNLLTDQAKIHDANWIPGCNDVIYLKSGKKGLTQLVVIDGSAISKEPYVAAEINAPISGVKIKRLHDGTLVFAAVGLCGDDGELFNDKAVESKSTARIFDDYYVRVVRPTDLLTF